MKKTSLIVLGSILLAFMVGLAPAALVWEEASNGGPSGILRFAVLIYIVLLAVVQILFLVGVRQGAFRKIESAKYRLLEIEEEDYYTPPNKEEEEVENATERRYQ